MSLITKNNYEAYLLDYVEENLSPELVAELMLFLEQNPDLKEALEDFEIYTLEPKETLIFDNSGLKKEAGIITLLNYEDVIIAEVEGENTPEKSAELHLFLDQNPDLKKEFIAYQDTKLVAPVVVFEHKEALKKKAGVLIPMYFWYSSAAAVVVVLFLLNGLNSNEQVYFPVADRGSVVSEEDEKKDSLNFYVFDDEIQVAVVEESKKVKREKSVVTPLNLPSRGEASALADFKKETESDTSVIENAQPEKEIINETDLYANVKITYEEEISDNGTPTPAKQKMTKLDMIRKATKQQINQNIEKGRGRLLLAFNATPLKLFKKKKKN